MEKTHFSYTDKNQNDRDANLEIFSFQKVLLFRFTSTKHEIGLCIWYCWKGLFNMWHCNSSLFSIVVCSWLLNLSWYHKQIILVPMDSTQYNALSLMLKIVTAIIHGRKASITAAVCNYWSIKFKCTMLYAATFEVYLKSNTILNYRTISN